MIFPFHGTIINYLAIQLWLNCQQLLLRCSETGGKTLQIYNRLKRIAIFEPKFLFNPLSANPTKWSNTLKQFVGILRTSCLSVFDHFVKLALKGLRSTASRSCLEVPNSICCLIVWCFMSVRLVVAWWITAQR